MPSSGPSVSIRRMQAQVYASVAAMVAEERSRFRHRKGHYIWIQDTFRVTRDSDGKPKELVGSWADISDRKQIESELQRVAGEVELRNRFIRETFGRYLTDEIVDTLPDSPTSLQIGGEKRKVTMTDLRGFTSLSERLAPKLVVTLLNRYFGRGAYVWRTRVGRVDDRPASLR